MSCQCQQRLPSALIILGRIPASCSPTAGIQALLSRASNLSVGTSEMTPPSVKDRLALTADPRMALTRRLWLLKRKAGVEWDRAFGCKVLVFSD